AMIKSTPACVPPHDAVTSFIDVFSANRRSIISGRLLGRRKKDRSPWKFSRSAKELTSFLDSRVGIGVFKCSSTWPGHEAAGTERFILAIVTIDLPPAQAAARVHDFPSRAAKNFLHGRSRCFDNYAATQAAVARFCGSGEA